jgi:uncharacterized protein YycO
VKKSIAITLLILLVIGLCSCGTKNPMKDALSATRNTGSIEIRVYSNTDQTYTDYVITDRATVREICDAFSSLELKNTKVGMYAHAYTVNFCNANGVAVTGLIVTASENNTIIYENEAYRVQKDFDVHAYVAGLIEGAAQK